MKKIVAILLILLIWSLSIGAERYEPMDFEAAGFQKIYATAYILKGTTANGETTRPGICACNPHLGEMAIIYTLDGRYLGTYSVSDTGSTQGLINGNVIDVWKANMTQAESFMKLIGPEQKVYVKWVENK